MSKLRFRIFNLPNVTQLILCRAKMLTLAADSIRVLVTTEFGKEPGSGAKLSEFKF